MSKRNEKTAIETSLDRAYKALAIGSAKDSEQDVQELLVALRHYCDLQGMDFYRLEDESYLDYCADLRERRAAQ